MDSGLKYTTFNADAGWIGILGSVKGLLRVTLPRISAQEAQQLLGDTISHAKRDSHSFEGLIARFRVYFSGDEVVFTDELDLAGATIFRRQVWEATRLIPYGETRSYMWVAKQINKPEAVRAVGQALSRNPLPVIVPCHRVLNIDGRLGGFSGGLEMKRYLLSMEGSATVR